MATQNFNLQVQLEGEYVGSKSWSGSQMHSTWNVENMDTNLRAVWGVSSDGWLQYQSAFGTYSMRYNSLDIRLTDNDFETEMQPAGPYNYEAGVVFKFKDRSNFYYVVMNGGYADWGGKNIRLMKRSGTSNFKLAEVVYPLFNRNTVYKIRVQTIGGNIKVWIDDVLVFDYTDSFPISNGAFGPIVMGQEFAKWRFFGAKSVSGFIVAKTDPPISVPGAYFDAANSMLLFPETVGMHMQAELDAYLATIQYDSMLIKRYVAITGTTKVLAIFDKVAGANTTTDSNARLYAYQIVPTSPPIPITDLRGTALSQTSIKYQWTHVDDSEDGFKIVDENDLVIATVGENVFEYIEDGLSEGITYKRRVIAFNAAGNSASSNEVIVTTLHSIPQVPIYFRGTALNNSSIRWEWGDIWNASSYEIVRFAEDGTPIVIHTLARDSSISNQEWIEQGLSPLTTYVRAVRAKNSAGAGTLSAPATVQTMDIVPDPPSMPPMNFTGVGVAHDKIMWSWEDINTNVDGYYIYDELGNRITTLSKDTLVWTEENLYSDMEYRHQISAFNKGGEGPKTAPVLAKTLPYGTDQEGTPLEPINLAVSEITQDSALLTWDYVEHELLKADGFKIYNDLDILIDVVPVTVRNRRIQLLTPDTSYRMYIVAFNHVGDSLPSNTVEWVTAKIPDPDVPEESSLPTDFVDPYYGLEYDFEMIETPKIEAFQAGVGDHLDLVIRNLQSGYYEEFQYEMYIKGFYLVQEEYYPVFPFRFKVSVDSAHADGTLYHEETSWIQSVVQGGDDGVGIRYDGAIGLPPVPDDVEISPSHYSVQFFDENDEEVPMYTGGNNKINWLLESRVREERVGFVTEIQMDNVFNHWQKFSHYGSAQPARATELETWIYDDTTGEIKTTVNSISYMGAVSPDKYDEYDTSMTLRSDDNDNDALTFILAFTVDESGREHTLSAVRRHDTSAWDWAIWYDYMQDTAMMLKSLKIDIDHSTWNLYYPYGTNVRAKRMGNVFEVWASVAGTDEILDSSYMTVTLSDDPRLSIFTGPQQIGVGAQSQQGGAVKISVFNGQKTKVFVENYITAWTKTKGTRTSEQEWIGAKTFSESIRIDALEERLLKGQIQSPAYQIPWQELNEKYRFVKYQLVLTTLNPNVWIEPVEKIQNFFPDDSTFIDFTIRAKIINHTQTNWHPSVHSGYYYLNQREHFLYASDKVLPKRDDFISLYMYKFPYIIRGVAEREKPAHTETFQERASYEFLLGTVSSGVEIFPIESRMTLSDSVSYGSFTSRILDFKDIVDSWTLPMIEQDETAVNEGASVKVEYGVVNADGSVAQWYLPEDMPPARRIRYKLNLTEGVQQDAYTRNISYIQEMLDEGYIDHVSAANGQIVLNDPSVYHDGTFITKPVDLGLYINGMGTIEVTIEHPELVDAYSVTASSEDHNFAIPTTNEPWIPLRKMAQTGNRIKFRVDSIPNRYVAFVFHLRSNTTTDPITTPIVCDITASPNLYTLRRVAPTIYGVKMEAFIPTRYELEEHVVSRMGEVIADQQFHDITKQTMEQLVLDYCASIGVPDLHLLTFKDYLVDVDPTYLVELEGSHTGKTPVRARTTAEVGEVMKQQEKFYFDVDTQEIILQPIPQTGSPIYIKNAQGTRLRQVHFRDEYGNPTLLNGEVLQTEDHQFLFLQYREHEIQRNTLQVFIDFNQNDEWTQIFNADIIQNRLILPNLYLPFLSVRVYYKLRDSFYVDYNYDVPNDHVRIKVNTTFDPNVKESRLLDIKYETKKDNAYYLTDEVDLNPLHTKINGGFLYLSDEYYPPYKMKLLCNPNKIYRSKEERLVLHAYVYDIHENPVVGEKISWETDYGTIEVISHITDSNGMATAVYQPLEDKLTNVAIVRATVIGRSRSSYLSKETKIELVDETFTNQLSLVPDKYIIQDGDVIQVRVIAMGPNQERIPFKELSITTNDGTIFPPTGTTDPNGELLVQYRHASGSVEPYIIIEAADSRIREQILLGTSGV